MALKVHVTGVSGLIGDVVYAHLAAQPERYEVTGSGRRYQPSERVAAGRELSCPQERFTRADLTDLAALEHAFAGAEVVAHMGAIPDPEAPFDDIVRSNVVGGYNTLEACRRQGVRRIVFASTVMTNWGYQLDEPYKAIREARFDAVPADFHRVTHRDPVRPTEPYSASKVWGEGLCRAYSDGHGLSCLCLRIGGVNANDAPRDAAGAALWCSQRDVATVVEMAVNAPPDLRFDIFYAVSSSRYRWLDAQHTRSVLGFEPADRAEHALNAKAWNELAALLESANEIPSARTLASQIRKSISEIGTVPSIPTNQESILSSIRESILIHQRESRQIHQLSDSIISTPARHLPDLYERLTAAKQNQERAHQLVADTIVRMRPAPPDDTTNETAISTELTIGPTTTSKQSRNSDHRPTEPEHKPMERAPHGDDNVDDGPHHGASEQSRPDDHEITASAETKDSPPLPNYQPLEDANTAVVSTDHTGPTTTSKQGRKSDHHPAAPEHKPMERASHGDDTVDDGPHQGASEQSRPDDHEITASAETKDSPPLPNYQPLEDANTVVVSTDDAHNVTRPQANSTSEETRRTFDRLMEAGRLDLAYWLAYSLPTALSGGRQPEPVPVRPSILGLVCEATQLLPGGACHAQLARYLDELADTARDWNDDERMLLATAVLQPLLFLQSYPPSLYSIIKSEAINGTLLDDLLGHIDDACVNRNITLDAELLEHPSHDNDAGARFRDMAMEASDFLKRVPDIGINWVPAEKVLQYLYAPGSDLNRLHRIIASDDRRRLSEADQLSSSLAPRKLIANALRAPELRQIKKLEGRARAKIERHLYDSRRLAVEWVHAVRRSTQEESPAAGRQAAIDLKSRTKLLLQTAIQRVSSGRQTSAVRAATLQLASLLRRLNGEQSQCMSVDEACIDLSGVMLDDDMLPFDQSLPAVCGALHHFLSEPADVGAVFDECLVRDEFVRATIMIDRHGLTEPFRERLDRRRRERRRFLRDNLSELQIKIEDAFLLDQLGDRQTGSSTSEASQDERSDLLAAVNDGQQKLRTSGRVLDKNIRQVAETVDEIEQRLNRLIHDRLTDLEREAGRLSDTFPVTDQGKDDVSYFRSALATCLGRSDYVAVFDLLDRARQSVTRNEPLARATIESSEHLERFISVAEEYRRHLGQVRALRDLPASIEKGRTIYGIPFAQLDDDRRRESRKVLEQWRELARSRLDGSNAKAGAAVAGVCRFVGFRVDTETLERGATRDGLAHFQVKITSAPSASPLPVFGSAIGERLDVIVSQRRYEPEQITEFLKQESLQDRAILVFLMDAVSQTYRLRWQTECSRSHVAALPLDLCLVFYLCGVRNRLPALFDIGLPFIWARPYITKGETVAPEMFVGRHNEIEDLGNPLGGCIVYGGRQLGKSALLTQLRREGQRVGVFVGYLDIDDLGIAPQAYDEMDRIFWRRVAGELHREGAIDNLNKDSRRPATSQEVSDAIGNRLSIDPESRILLLLDETDNLLDLDSSHNFGLVRRLRALMASTNRRFKVVFAGLQSVQRYKNWRNHPFAQLGAEIVIMPLAPQPAQELIIRPFRSLGFAFSDTTLVLRILSLANYHPGLIQIFCFRLLERLYNKWQRRDTNGPSPIRHISTDDVTSVERDESIREDIRNRFDWTLDLDDRYKALTYALVLTPNPTTPRTESAFLALGCEWWPAVFEKMDPQALRAVLDEMVGLGVLLRDQADVNTAHYRLRSPNLLRLLGPQEVIEAELMRIMALDRVSNPNPRNFHPIIERRPLLFGPLTKEQEGPIVDTARPFSLALILGSPAMGLRAVPRHIHQLLREEGRDDVAEWRDATPSFNVGGTVTINRIAQALREEFRRDRRGHRYVLLDFERTYFNEDIGALIERVASDLSRRCAPKSRGKVIVLIGPSQMWNWIQTEARQRIQNNPVVSIMNVRRWSDGALANALDILGLRTNSRQTGQELSALTSGVYDLVSEILSESQPLSQKSTDAKQAILVATSVRERRLGDDRSRLLAELGIQDDGSGLYDYLVELIGLSEEIDGHKCLTQASFDTALDALRLDESGRDALRKRERDVLMWLGGLDLVHRTSVGGHERFVLCSYAADLRDG